MMTKKDFDKIATIIYRLPDEVKVHAVESAFDVLESEPKFDPYKFALVAGTFPCHRCKEVFSNSEDRTAHLVTSHPIRKR